MSFLFKRFIPIGKINTPGELASQIKRRLPYITQHSCLSEPASNMSTYTQKNITWAVSVHTPGAPHKHLPQDSRTTSPTAGCVAANKLTVHNVISASLFGCVYEWRLPWSVSRGKFSLHACQLCASHICQEYVCCVKSWLHTYQEVLVITKDYCTPIKTTFVMWRYHCIPIQKCSSLQKHYCMPMKTTYVVLT